jgi:phage replication O-like protein O
MANPQKEDGYIGIACEIAEALTWVNLSPYESRVLWFIFRKTYGWGKKMESIPLSQFAKSIKLDRRLVHRTIKSLRSKHMLVISRDDRGDISYGFQKNWELWGLSSPKMTVISTDDKVSSLEMTKVSSPEIPPIDNKKEKDSPPKNQPPKTKPPVALSGEQADRFSQFYAAYPKKRAKQDAIKAWKKVAPENGLFETIMRAIKKQKRSDDWTRDNGRYIPNPASWLNGRRWEDEIEAPGPARRTGAW